MRLRELMGNGSGRLDAKMPILMAYEHMVARNLKAVPVCGEGGSLIGVVSAERCAEELASNGKLGYKPIRYLVDGSWVSVDIDAEVVHALRTMAVNGCSWLVVQECGLLSGLAHWSELVDRVDSNHLERILNSARTAVGTVAVRTTMAG